MKSTLIKTASNLSSILLSEFLKIFIVHRNVSMAFTLVMISKNSTLWEGKYTIYFFWLNNYFLEERERCYLRHLFISITVLHIVSNWCKCCCLLDSKGNGKISSEHSIIAFVLRDVFLYESLRVSDNALFDNFTLKSQNCGGIQTRNCKLIAFAQTYFV